MRQDAVVPQILVIAEASRRISDEFNPPEQPTADYSVANSNGVTAPGSVRGAALSLS